MAAQRERLEPPSRTIAAALREAIASGHYAPGDRLPSVRELAAEHGTARNTAREAIMLLQRDGLVLVEHGRGTFVRHRPQRVRMGGQRYSRRMRSETGLSPFRAEAQRLGKQARVEVPEIGQVHPPADVAERLGVDTGTPSVLRRLNHYYLDETPVQVGITYIPWILAEGSVLATEARTGPASIYARLAELGHEITRAREEITARMPRPEEVLVLAVPVGVPIIELLHTGLDQDGNAFEVTRFVMRADTTALDYLLPIDD